MKNKKIIIGICFIVLLLAVILVIFNINNNNKINTKDDIIKMNDLMQELLTSKETKLCVQEVTGTKSVDYIYKK